MLEEAGSETIQLIRNTKWRLVPEHIDRELDGLVNLGYVYRTDRNGEPEVVLTKEGSQALTR
jgi:hypothetical protein